VQADSGSDSDSESRKKNEEIIPVNLLTQTVCNDPPEPATNIRTCTVKQRTFFAPVGTKNVLCLTVQLRIVVACSGGSVQTVWVRRFTGMISAQKCPLFNSAGSYIGGRFRRVGADSLGQTIYRNDFLILVPTLGIGVGT